MNSNVLIARSTGDAQLDKAVWQWLSWDKVRGGGAGVYLYIYTCMCVGGPFWPCCPLMGLWGDPGNRAGPKEVALRSPG